MINFIWAVTYCEYLYKDEGANALLTVIHWQCTGTDDVTENFARNIGTEDVSDAGTIEPSATVNQTAQQTLLDLLFDSLGPEKTVIEKSVKDQVDALNNPTGGGFTPPPGDPTP